MNGGWTARRAAVGLLALVCAGCSLGALNAISRDEYRERHAGIVFDPTTGLKLDVYEPKQAAGGDAIVFFYGGSWQDGRREDYVFMASALAEAGFLVVVPDYRLYPEVRFPVFVEDAAAAVCWSMRNIERYGGRVDRVSVMGHSAGAHIAALLHYDESYLAASGCEALTRAFVGVAGPYDFLPLVSPTLQKVFPTDSRPDSQPVNFVDGREGPALLLHGLQDDTVEPRNSTRLAEVVAENGGVAEVRIYDGRGHIGVLLAFARPLRRLAPALDDVAKFMRGLEASQITDDGRSSRAGDE